MITHYTIPPELADRVEIDPPRLDCAHDNALGTRPARPPISGFERVQTAISGPESDAKLDPKLLIYRPALAHGHITIPVRADLEVIGQAWASNGIAAIEASVDGQNLGAPAFRPGSPGRAAIDPGPRRIVISSFGITVPGSMVGPGAHTVRVEVRDRSGHSASLSFAITGKGMPNERTWALRRKLAQAEIDLGMRILAGLDWRPHFTLLLRMPSDGTGIRAARDTLESLADQAYQDWRVIVLAKDSRESRQVRELVDGFEEIEEKIALRSGRASADPAITEIIGGTEPGFFGLLRAGDVLGSDALLEIAIASGLSSEAEFFYSDERRLDPVTRAIEPFLKPQWSPDLLLSTNYIGRLWVARTDLLRRTCPTLRDLERFGEYDLVLRLTEKAASIRHVPKLLCEQRGFSEPAEAARGALRRALARRGITGTVERGAAAGVWRIKRNIAADKGVSILIPTCARHGLIRTCIDSLRAKTAYRNFEIIAIDNIPAAESGWKRWLGDNADTVVPMPGTFNWSRFNNLAAQKAKGEFLLFLNDDIEIIEPDWLDALLEHAQRHEVGVVGALLLYPDRKVQHAGMVLAGPSLARHAFRYATETDPGPFGITLATRNTIAVTGACMMVRRVEFEKLGGFDEAHRVINNDVDYCLRSYRSGLLTVFTPYSRLVHHERGSRDTADEDYDAAAFDARWRDLFAAGDPYFNPLLSRNQDGYSADPEPVRVVHCARPLVEAGDIRRVLAIKLDHIGDIVSALPALRRLKQHFPGARVILLASPNAAALAAMEPSIDEVVEFEFFFRHSGQAAHPGSGRKLEAVVQRLQSYRFDLAIDLRTRPETRHLLRYSGAKWLAGFDHRYRFPWLDIALEWEEDPRPGGVKRHPICDDLVRLIDAVATACTPAPLLMDTRLRHDSSRFVPFGRELPQPYICVHPGAGNEMKLWPPEHFAELIDLLAAKHRVAVVLVGAAEEAELATAVLAKVRHRQSVISLVGQLPLADLPELIAGCVLFVGNDSGPKHIAAGLGVPTVAIHSGWVAAGEFGPVGPNAVSVMRDMSCSPCYLAERTQCKRNLACLTQLGAGDVYRVCERMLAIAMPLRHGHSGRLGAAQFKQDAGHRCTSPSSKAGILSLSTTVPALPMRRNPNEPS